MYGIVKGIPIPDDLPVKRAGAPKYPFGEMEVNDSFVVPYGDRNKDETDEEFRARILKSAAQYVRKDVKAQEGKNEPPVRKDFGVKVMTSDDISDAKAYVAGDAVVWRTA